VGAYFRVSDWVHDVEDWKSSWEIWTNEQRIQFLCDLVTTDLEPGQLAVVRNLIGNPSLPNNPNTIRRAFKALKSEPERQLQLAKDWWNARLGLTAAQLELLSITVADVYADSQSGLEVPLITQADDGRDRLKALSPQGQEVMLELLQYLGTDAVDRALRS